MKSKKLNFGDVILVELEGVGFIVGIILHISKVFRSAAMIGFVDQVFQKTEDIGLDTLDGRFVNTPNYVVTQPITSGEWRVIGNVEKLAGHVDLPKLRVSYDVYYKDDIIDKVDIADFGKYETLSVAGKKYVELILRQYFSNTD